MTVASSIRNYQVAFSDKMIFLEACEQIPHRFYIIDKNVWELYQSSLERLDQARVHILPISEEAKCLETVMAVYDVLMKSAAKRNMTMISIGGGITQDITGFVASTLYRGINWIYVPTTLLAQADSCIGSKTSLNYQKYKNLVGTFYPPTQIYINTGFLATLEAEDFYSGLGEVIKLYMMGGESSAATFIHNSRQIKQRNGDALMRAIQDVLTIKLQYIEEDEFDGGRRNLLNFGHCLGHALESTTNFAIPHGQAVLVGILFANIIARLRGYMSKARYESFNRDLILDNIHIDRGRLRLDVSSIFEAMKMDKKRVGEGLALIMMRDDYNMLKVQDLQYDELARGLRELAGTVHLPIEA